MQLMLSIHDSIVEGCFPQFVSDFMIRIYPNKNYPQWSVDALNSVNIELR